MTTWLDYDWAFAEGAARVHVVQEPSTPAEQQARGSQIFAICGSRVAETGGSASMVIGEISEHGVCERCLLRVVAADDVVEGRAHGGGSAALSACPPQGASE